MLLEFISIILMALNIDNSGYIIKFLLTYKFLIRLNLLDINFGYWNQVTFDNFRGNLEFLNEGDNQIHVYGNEKNKYFSTQQGIISFDYTKDLTFRLKTYLYFLAFLVKKVSDLILNRAKKNKEITVYICWFIKYTQIIHFVLYSLISCDVIFLSIRSLAHTKTSFGLSSKAHAILASLMYLHDTSNFLFRFYLIQAPTKEKIKQSIKNKIESKLKELRDKMTIIQDSTLEAIKQEKTIPDEHMDDETHFQTQNRSNQISKIHLESTPVKRKIAQQTSNDVHSNNSIMPSISNSSMPFNKISPLLRTIDQAVVKKEMRSIGVSTDPITQISLNKMYNKLKLNEALMKFSFSQLSENPELFEKKNVVKANFMHIIRLQLYTFLITAMPRNVIVVVALISILELKQFCSILYKQCKYNHLKNGFVIFEKLFRSLIIMINLGIYLYHLIQTWLNETKYVSVSMHKIWFYFNIFMFIFELLVLLLKLFGSIFAIISWLVSKKYRQKNAQQFIEYVKYDNSDDELDIQMIQIEDRIDFSEFITKSQIKKIQEMARIQEQIASPQKMLARKNNKVVTGQQSSPQLKRLKMDFSQHGDKENEREVYFVDKRFSSGFTTSEALGNNSPDAKRLQAQGDRLWFQIQQKQQYDDEEDTFGQF